MLVSAQDVAFCLCGFSSWSVYRDSYFLSERSFASVSLTGHELIVSLLVFTAMVVSLRVLHKRKEQFLSGICLMVFAIFGFKYLLEVFLANKNLCDGYWPRRCYIAQRRRAFSARRHECGRWHDALGATTYLIS